MPDIFCEFFLQELKMSSLQNLVPLRSTIRMVEYGLYSPPETGRKLEYRVEEIANSLIKRLLQAKSQRVP